MGKIKVLSEFLANQIAAGEVVQNPESVVKELVENSLDAGANTICVFLQKSGKTLIQILDDGCGMSKEDLLLAPLRHTTSKLFTSEQLDEIRTFGFRGEALAAISSVSLLEIQTRRAEDEHGWRLQAEPLKEFVVEPINMQVGTQIFVKNLFFNTPARRKFLKTDLTEFKKVDDTLKRIAIAHPDKRFIFYDNNKLIFDAKPAKLENRIIELVASSYSDGNLLKVDKTFANNIKISGYVGQPQLAKTGATTQYLFLNKRPILSKQLSYAVFLAFEHLIARNLKPFFVLNLEVDYKSVDVNVHPQKNEVRFDNERFIFTCVKDAVEDALKITNLIETSAVQNTIEIKDENKILTVDKETGEVVEKRNKPNYFSNDLKEKHIWKSFQKNTYDKASQFQIKKATDTLYNSISQERYKAAPNENVFKNNSFTEEKYTVEKTEQNYSDLQDYDISDTNIWQLHNKYIFLQVRNGFIAIDQHNAHERYIYEDIIYKLNNNSGIPQALLFPVTIKLNYKQIETIKDIEQELKRIGFDFEIENENVIISATPSDLKIGDAENAICEIIDEYENSETLKHSSKQEKIAATVACKSAIKAGQALELNEMKTIISNLFKCKMPHICPHGRPIIIHFTMQELDKRFGRI